MIPQIRPVYNASMLNTIEFAVNNGSWLTEHEYTAKFERSIGSIVSAPFVHAVPSGTMALMVALKALDLQWCKVAVPNLTMVASANAVLAIGGIPVLVDVDDSGCMSYEKLSEVISDVDAVLFVSLNGRSGDILKISDLCKRNGIRLIEDACQSLGATVDGRSLGTIGDIGCYSFSPHKIVSTGQGGAIVTSDELLYRKMYQIKDFGRTSAGSNSYDGYGINAKFTDLQAIVGLSQIDELAHRISFKKSLYNKYRDVLRGYVDFVDHSSTPWMVDIYVENPLKLGVWLKYKGVGTRLHYPCLNILPHLIQSIDAEKSTIFSRHGLFLPSSINLTFDTIEYICNAIKEFYDGVSDTVFLP